MSTVSVSETDDLPTVLAAYGPKVGAKIEFNIHDEGLSIVANRMGWESLAEWCLTMAHPDMEDSIQPSELTENVLPSSMFIAGDAILSFWGLKEHPSSVYQDVFFHRSTVIGDEFWEGAKQTGNSPYTKPAAYEALDRYRWLELLPRADVEEKLGQPIFERRSAGNASASYKADTPEGWIGVDYDSDDMVGWFGFGMTPMWEQECPDGVLVWIPYEGDENAEAE
jgi:hypothetical protein